MKMSLHENELIRGTNLVPRAFSLDWAPSQGKGPGNEVEEESISI